MRILILGAAGFIGTHLSRYLENLGHEVIALCRSGIVLDFQGVTRKWKFGDPLGNDVIEGVQCAIHLAHDFSGPEGAMLTQEETLKNVAHLRENQVQHQMIFSSYSAGSHATSLYARTKTNIEQRLIGATDVVIVRPGLVLGDGGIFGRIKHWATNYPVVPLPDGGYGQIPTITIEKLCREIAYAVSLNSLGQELNIFEKELPSLRSLVKKSAADVNKFPIIINIPSKLIFFILRIASLLNIRLPVNADNLEGFLANQSAQHQSTLLD